MTTSRVQALGPPLVLFAVMLGHALLETARDALFVTRLGVAQLPWAYLAIAIAAIATLFAARRWFGSRDPRRFLIASLLASAFGTGVIAVLVGTASLAVFVLYVWTGIVVALVVPAFWLVIDRQHRVAEAKRTFARIAAAGSIGAFSGSAVAAAVGTVAAPGMIVVLAALVFGLASVAAASLLAPAGPSLAPRARALRGGQRAQVVRSGQYVRRLLLLAFVGTIVLTLADLMFKRALAGAAATHELAPVFGAVYAGVNLLALVIQLAVAPRLLDRLGVGGALTVLPLVVLATTLGFAVSGSAIAIVALKLGDGALRHSLHRVAGEILFLPLSSSLRESARHLIDIIGQRGGQAAAALLVLAVGGQASSALLAGLILVAVSAWLAVILAARRGYVQQFRDRLDAGDLQREGAVPTLDADSVAFLTASLSSPDEAEALAALDLLAQRGDRIPALVLYHPSTAVVRKALSLLQGDARRDIARVLARLTSHDDPTIRASALAASSRTGCNHEHLLAALQDPEAEVRAAAVISLAAKACSAAPLARAKLSAMIAGSTDERIALARAIGRTPHRRYREHLVQLIAHGEPAVAREVLRVWAEAPELADIERLLSLLDDPHVRGDARRVFIAGGAALFPRLLEALEDPRTPLGTRRHLPRTISRFRTVAAGRALSDRLLREPDGTTEFKILRALGRMRADDPTLSVDTATIRVYVQRALDDASRYAMLACALGRMHRDDRSVTMTLLRELLVEKHRHAVERVFRALGILYPQADMHSLHDAIASGDEDRHAAAREVLEDVLPASLRVVLAVLDRTDRSRDTCVNQRELLATLLRDPSDSLRCIAAHLIAEQRIVALRPELVRLKPTTASSLVTHAFEQAIARLDA